MIFVLGFHNLDNVQYNAGGQEVPIWFLTSFFSFLRKRKAFFLYFVFYFLKEYPWAFKRLLLCFCLKSVWSVLSRVSQPLSSSFPPSPTSLTEKSAKALLLQSDSRYLKAPGMPKYVVRKPGFSFTLLSNFSLEQGFIQNAYLQMQKKIMFGGFY